MIYELNNQNVPIALPKYTYNRVVMLHYTKIVLGNCTYLISPNIQIPKSY